MFYRIFFLGLCLLLGFTAHAEFVRGQFEVVFERQKVVVHSPFKFKGPSKVFLRNQTPENILLQVLKASGERITFLTMGPGEDRLESFTLQNAQDYITIMPLDPALQEINLSYGKPTFETPPPQK